MEKLIKLLVEKYNIHTLFLYGSRTTETFFPESDYDILAIRKDGSRVREVFAFENLSIDLIVDNEDLINYPENFIYLWSNQLLLDEQGFGKKILDVHRKYLLQPAVKLSQNRTTQRLKQIQDELKYIKQDNILGHYRHHDLLSKILPLYFNLIGEWYLGDKHALKWLEKNKPEFFRIISKALQPGASFEQIEQLVNYVCNLKE